MVCRYSVKLYERITPRYSLTLHRVHRKRLRPLDLARCGSLGYCNILLEVEVDYQHFLVRKIL
jgi:hypothetical protein